METRRLFADDAYIQHFTATVIDCQPIGDRFAIELDQTAFYPEGGGQPADQGSLGGWPVLDVQEREGQIRHILGAPLPAGSTVEGEIDWPLRFERMQHHTGEHIVSGIVNRLFGYDNVGFHMGSENVTIDFSGELPESGLDQVEWLANQAVYRNEPVRIAYPDPATLNGMAYRSKKALDGAVRIVTIPDTDCCACCGTHTRQTGEVGLIKFIKAEKYKGGTRVTLICGSRALLDYRDRLKNIATISQILSAKPTDVRPAVEKIAQELMLAKKRIAALKQKIWEQQADQAGKIGETAIVFTEDLSTDDLRQFCQILTSRVKLALVLSPSGESACQYAISTADGDIRPLAADLNQRFNGRGGGKPNFCQGLIQGNQAEISAYLEQALARRVL